MTGAAPAPEVSYIVLSYNYENFVGATIRSILEQTHQNFEIVVVDDCSTDRSCEVIEAFCDPRIRLLRNARNLGGAGSYNRAVEAARGTWLSNLDADDWIEPGKTWAQLDILAGRPDLAVIGSYVSFVGPAGTPLADATLYEQEVNVPRDFNVIDTWIGRNALCRSSTMVRREAHLKVGLDDATMVRAPDYELWTRFLRHGYRLHAINEKLVNCRLHSCGVTYADPVGTFTEMCWIALRNLRPAAEAIGAWSIFDSILNWIVRQPRLSELTAQQRTRIVGLMVADRSLADYADYRAALDREDAWIEAIGRRVMGCILDRPLPNPVQTAEARVSHEVLAALDADFHRNVEAQAEIRRIYEEVAAYSAALEAARTADEGIEEALLAERTAKIRLLEAKVDAQEQDIQRLTASRNAWKDIVGGFGLNRQGEVEKTVQRRMDATASGETVNPVRKILRALTHCMGGSA